MIVSNLQIEEYKKFHDNTKELIKAKIDFI